MAVVGALGLAGHRDRSPLATELFGRVAAHVVEAPGELGLQPSTPPSAGLQVDLGRQPLGLDVGGGDAAGVVAHPEVHEAVAQIGRVDPRLHCHVVRVGHQHRQAERPHHPLGAALPGALGFPNLQQLAGERHFLGRNAERGTEQIAELDLVVGDVGGAGAQTAQLGLERLVLLLA